MGPAIVDVTEQKRLNDAREAQIPWKKWGPYLSERQWGTVREDYSENGDAWNYFTHDQARSRAYKWGEDGLGGLCDDKQRLCFALALWNERDPILKERMFGLTNNEGESRRGCERILFLPRQHANPLLHEIPLQVPATRVSLPGSDRNQPETIAGRVRVRAARYRDLRRGPLFRRVRRVRQGKILKTCSSGSPCTIAGSEAARLRVLPTLWFRNTWSWGRGRSQAFTARSGSGRHSGHTP